MTPRRNHKLTLTQRVLDHLGTRREVAMLLQHHTGIRITKQAVSRWYIIYKHLPFNSCERYATILAKAARKRGFDVTKEDLLAEVEVPDYRLPRVSD